MFIDAETLIIYFDETNHSLHEIEKDLILLEEMGTNVDMTFANNIFRKMHIIKSGASILGLSKIKELSQKLENLLGLICNGKLVPNPEIVNILLHGCDNIKQLSRNQSTKQEIDIDEQSVMLTGLTSAVLPDDKKNSVTRIREISLLGGNLVFQIPEFNLFQVFDQGKSIYILEFDLIHDVQEKNNTPLDLVRLVQQHGEIIDCLVDIKSVGTLEERIPTQKIPYFVLLASSKTQDQLVKELKLPSVQVNELKNEFDDLIQGRKKDEKNQNESNKKQNIYMSTFFSEYQQERLSDLSCELEFACRHLLNDHEKDHIHKLTIDRIHDVLKNLQSHVHLNYQLPVSKCFWELIRNVHDYSFQSGNKARLNLFCEGIHMDSRIIAILIQPLTEIITKMIPFFSNDCSKGIVEKDATQIDLMVSENEQNFIIEIFSYDHIPIPENSFLDFKSEVNHLNSVLGELLQQNHTEKGFVVNITLPRLCSIINGWPVVIDGKDYIIPRINVCDCLQISDISKDSDIKETDNHLWILYQESWLPVICISNDDSFVKIQSFVNQNKTSVLICNVGMEKFALPVDSIENSEINVVIQPNRHLNSGTRIVSTCLLKSGSIAFIPDMGDLGYQSMQITS